MKRLMGVFIKYLLISGCSSKDKTTTQVKSDNDTYKFSAKVIELNKDSLLVDVIFGSDFDEVLVKIDNSDDKQVFIYDPKQKTRVEFPANLKIGDKIIISFSGIATRSIPPQITSNKFIWKLADDAPTDFRDWKLFNNGKIACGC